VKLAYIERHALRCCSGLAIGMYSVEGSERRCVFE